MAGKAQGKKLLQIKISGFNYLISAKNTKCYGIGLKVIPEMWKMTAATSLLSKPERSLQSPANPDTLKQFDQL
jgi:hypothetical protein